MSSGAAEVHHVPTAQTQSSLSSAIHLYQLVRYVPGRCIIEHELIAMQMRPASAAINRRSRPQTAIGAQAHQLVAGNIRRCQHKASAAILTVQY